MNKPWDIIKELEADNSRLAKEAIIEREALADNIDFFDGAKLTLDALITYGIKKVPEQTKQGGQGLNPKTFTKIIEALSNRQLTGNLASTAVLDLMHKATADEWNHWYRRILIKDLRCGVSEKTINTAVKKANKTEYTVPVFTCQLAHDSANHEAKIIGQKLVEVKLDGVRVITVVHPDGKVDQYSRNGKELVNFANIKQQISKHGFTFKESVVLDGEVMSSSFQDLMKQVHRKDNVDAKDTVLNLFDILSLREFLSGSGNHRQLDRSVSLQAWFNEYGAHMPNVDVVAQELIDLDTEQGQNRYKELNQLAIDGGYEGIMIKDPEAVYECKRSTSWLKLKPFIEVTLEVVDLEEGTGRNEGRLGAFICQGEDDGRIISVNCGSGFSDNDRDSFWSDRREIVGRLVEVRADAITKNQDQTYSLRFPRFKGFRGFEPGEKM
jgi:DNA ligase-1